MQHKVNKGRIFPNCLAQEASNAALNDQQSEREQTNTVRVLRIQKNTSSNNCLGNKGSPGQKVGNPWPIERLRLSLYTTTSI